ncbi:MAG: hypothetical protein R2706_18095 [Acidimicrobiales bacterium]
MASGILRSLSNSARRGESVYQHGALESLLRDELLATTFDQLKVPFQCVATDIDSARETWFDSGELVPALLASSALPPSIRPW